MDFKMFASELIDACSFLDVKFSEVEANKFYSYMNLLIDWNKKINLTAIKEPKDIILKHFVDSLTIFNNIPDCSKIADIGTGAGFPGIPIAIANSSCNITLVDSLNKRINFLNEIINHTSLTNTTTIHSRAEEFGKNKKYRESFDIAVSRAVAPLNILLEYMLPVVKVGGICICMKAQNVDEELNLAQNACNVLGGYVEKIDEVTLPYSDIIRKNIVIKKISNTPFKYPRKPGTPSKEPL